MSASVLVHRARSADLSPLSPEAFRDELFARREKGERVLTMYARRDGEGVLITAVTLSPGRQVSVARALASAERGYHALTSAWPALHCFEREMHEQTGLRLAGHPWLKPVRFEGQEQKAMNGYPFYAIEGKEVHEVAVGPIHAGVIEPGSFRFMCLGEVVHHLEIHLGYQHRGVERLLLGRDPKRLAPLVETVAGDSSVAHTWAYCSAIEALSGTVVPEGDDAARAIALELERVGMHLATLSGIAADIGFLQGATTYGRLRTTAINTTMKLCGSRFGRGALRPGGVRLSLSPERLADIEAAVGLLSGDIAVVNECFLGAQTVLHRLEKVGVLTTEQARDLGVVGVAARASGLAVDTRKGAGGAYARSPVEPATSPDGDCLSRARVRIAEIDASLSFLSSMVKARPACSNERQSTGPLAPGELAVAAVEGVRGEVVHCLETDERGGLVHYKVQDPSLRNWMGLAIAVRQNEISDFPICNKSFDLSYCGNDL